MARKTEISGLLSTMTSRRDFVKRSIVMVGAIPTLGSLLAACGGDDDDDDEAGSEPTATTGEAGSEPTATTGEAAEPTATEAGAEEGGATEAEASSTEAESGAEEGQYGGEIVVAQSDDATTLDPAITTATVDVNIYQSIYNSLLVLDENGDLAPSLVTSWEVADDNLSWTLNLQEGVKFHDGTDFNAEAVKFNIERFIAEETNSPRKGEIPFVTGVTVIDELTAQIDLSQPFSTLGYAFAAISGHMASPAAIEEFGEDFARNPVGTGPFVFEEWVRGDQILVSRNENYWKEGLPYLDSISYKGISDSSVVINGFRSGSLHATYSIPANNVEEIQNTSGLELIIVPSTSVNSLRFNLAVEPFDRKEVRQALSWAVDRQAIEDALYFGLGTPANSFIGPQHLGYNPDITLYTDVDLDRARELLASVDLSDGFEFTAMVFNAPGSVELAEALKSQYQEIGVTMEIELLDTTSLLGRLVEAQFEAALVQYNGGVEPFQGFTRFFWSESTINAYSYLNEEFDALLSEAGSTPDSQARAEIYQQMAAILSEDAPWAFIRHPERTQLFQESIEGYIYNPDGALHLETVWLST